MKSTAATIVVALVVGCSFAFSCAAAAAANSDEDVTTVIPKEEEESAFSSNKTVPTVDRIIGGTQTTIDKYPYQVSLRRSGDHYCGGAIISPWHVLTAAHCIVKIAHPPYRDITVVTGSSVSYGNWGERHRVRRIVVHPNYAADEKTSFANDLAVITIADTIRYNQYQRKIELPSRDVTIGDVATITGWGVRKYPSYDASPNLEFALQRLIPLETCAKMVKPYVINNQQICALNRKGIGACSGDSGGPLVAHNRLIGVISWIIPCAEGYPDIYSNLIYHVDWIRSQMSRF
ncbi:hypothetical protein TKK_0018522 [Trichogramma kaykai]|uniref:Peptidase S1 domain-containing protein n=1 Tax=Trichogramma kaykai TaxID=54128 RepID=A0ABD2VYM9_9HYME